jgi:hypothetical protein
MRPQTNPDKLKTNVRILPADGLDVDALCARHPQGQQAAALVLAALAPHVATGLVQQSVPAGARHGSVRLADPGGLLVSNDIISDVFAAFDITDDAQD